MLMTRFSLLMLLFHVTSFFQMLPHKFVWGLVTWPWYFVQAMLIADEDKRNSVAAGCRWSLQNEGEGVIPTMPVFLRKRFEAMHQEAVS